MIKIMITIAGISVMVIKDCGNSTSSHSNPSSHNDSNEKKPGLGSSSEAGHATITCLKPKS